MIGCLRTRVRKQPIIVLYFELENELEFITSGPGHGDVACMRCSSSDVVCADSDDFAFFWVETHLSLGSQSSKC